MARIGLLSLCAGVVIVAGPLTWLPHSLGEDRNDAVANALAVQTALTHAKSHLEHANPKAAVYELEKELARINGNREYLAVLREAYRAHIRELRLANQEEQAQQYQRRLLILDPGANLDPVPKTVVAAPAAKPIAREPAKPAVTARAQADDDPFQDDGHTKQARQLVDKAKEEFTKRHYGVASQLFEQACQTDKNLADGCRDYWAYCKLHQVTERLNEENGPVPQGLEQEVRVALAMAPRLEKIANELLKKIEERRGQTNGAAASATAVTAVTPQQLPHVQVTHGAKTPEGWSLAETTNFRVFHTQSQEVAERAAQILEHTRTRMQQKWFAQAGPKWNPKCDVFLHATGEDYSRNTPVPASSPGHSEIKSEGSRIIVRRIHVHMDVPDALTAVLPHETTHVVLAGGFGTYQVPRWVDEGVAVLTEPREKIEKHLHNLPHFLQERQLFGVKQLVQMEEYPDPRYIGPFYAQSVSLVEFLSRQKTPEVFTQFVYEGLRGGYEPALKRIYGFKDFSELEQRWEQYAFGTAAVSTNSQ
jgi:tetratricopeptide (TPR) repeat protein